MKFERTGAATYAPLAGFLIGVLGARLVIPLMLYLVTLWFSSHWYGVVRAPDVAQLLKVGMGWEAGLPSPGWLVAAVVATVTGLVLIVRGRPLRSDTPESAALRTDGVYAWLRHPQYAGCILVMLGFLAARPEPLSAAVFVVYAGIYVLMARAEDRALARAHGAQWQRYAQRTAAFVPSLRCALRSL